MSEGPWELDHLVPCNAGGLSIEENLVVSCRECNRRKSDKDSSHSGDWVALDEEALRRLMNNSLGRQNRA